MLSIPLTQRRPNVHFAARPFRLLLQSAKPLHPPGALASASSRSAQVHPKSNQFVDDACGFDLIIAIHWNSSIGNKTTIELVSEIMIRDTHSFNSSFIHFVARWKMEDGSVDTRYSHNGERTTHNPQIYLIDRIPKAKLSNDPTIHLPRVLLLSRALEGGRGSDAELGACSTRLDRCLF